MHAGERLLHDPALMGSNSSTWLGKLNVSGNSSSDLCAETLLRSRIINLVLSPRRHTYLLLLHSAGTEGDKYFDMLKP
jgi:hypothetical protein